MIDLHMHTNCSDGSDDPIELLKKAEVKKLSIISITDHNTVEAYKIIENINLKEFYKGRIIPGIELNTKILGIPIEILGYGIDYKKVAIELPKIFIGSRERNITETKRLYEKCLKAGIKFEENCLDRYDPESFASKFIKSELMKFEENKNIISEDAWNDTRIFYRKYMSNPECPLYVEMDDLVPEFDVVANLIKNAGGLVFLPHIFEYRENSMKILTFILDNYKIDGIECFYTTFSDEQKNELLKNM